jgi:hypothetical protein
MSHRIEIESLLDCVVRGRLLPMFGDRGQVPNTQNNHGRKIVLPAVNHNET